MKPPANATLDRLLETALRHGADELLLMSGKSPMLSVTSSLQKVDGPELTASMIRDIHLACLAQANSEIPAAGATFAYRMISATHGPVRCTYTVKRSARTLLLVPEGKAAEYVLSGGAAKPPALRAEAKIGRESGGGGKA